MKLFLLIAGGILASFIKISDQDNKLKPVPIFDCDPKKESDVIKVQGLTNNATFVEDNIAYGPWRCDYMANIAFTAKTNLKGLKYYSYIQGTDFAREVDVCEGGMEAKLEPSCGEMQQDYILSMVFPGPENLGKFSIVFGFKNGSDVISCNHLHAYLFESDCCN